MVFTGHCVGFNGGNGTNKNGQDNCIGLCSANGQRGLGAAFNKKLLAYVKE